MRTHTKPDLTIKKAQVAKGSEFKLCSAAMGSLSHASIDLHMDRCLLNSRSFLIESNDKWRVNTFTTWSQGWTAEEDNGSAVLGLLVRKRDCKIMSSMPYCENPRISPLTISNVRILRLLETRRVKGHETSADHDSSGSELNSVPLVKICGVTNVTDAVMAAKAGAKFVGMILWPKSKRSISLDAAKAIACAVRLHHAEPVGVFVDEDAETILKHCQATGIQIAQLHGEGARSSLPYLPSCLKSIYVLHVDKNGTIQTPLPTGYQVDWILMDNLQGGSGITFDWEKYDAPALTSKHGWLLAGGLNPDNVAAAISVLKPNGVDVSSGVTGPDGVLKDHAQVSAFMDAVKTCDS